MLTPALSSFPTIDSNDAQLSGELKLARLRAQAAVVRALMNHIGSCARTEGAEGLREPPVEVDRLGLLEAAISTARLPLQEDRSICLRHAASAPESPPGVVAR